MNRNLAIVYAVVGLVVAVALILDFAGVFAPRGTALSNGQLIYTRGIDENGVVLTYSGGPGMGMMGRSCAGCHGSDGRGGYYPMMCGTVSADIRYSSLIAEGFDNSTIKRAITRGLDEKGESLSACMPRWSMSEKDLNDLTGYLIQLG